MKTIRVLVFSLLVICCHSLPQNLFFGNGMTIRSRGQHGMVFTGYFGPNQNFDSENPLTPEESQLNEEESEIQPEIPNENTPKLEENQKPNDNNSDTENPEPTDEKPDENEEKPMKNSEEDDDEDDDEEDSDEDYDYWPFFGGRTGGTNFFPISFLGGLGRSEQNPSNIAIANSFSTGKKGIASSNARAGGPQSENYSDFRPKRQNLEETINPIAENPEADPTQTNETPEISTETPLTDQKTVTEETPQEVTTKKNAMKNSKPRRKNPFGNQPVNFFPILFGNGRSLGTSLGNIAIANSYSTGKNGMALSNARSFGSFVPQEGDPSDVPEIIPEENDPVLDLRKGKGLENARYQEEPKENSEEPSKEETEEPSQEDGVYLFQKRGQESFVNFFPITFGVLGRYSVNPSTAVANSFSTGTKGVAKSNAEASGSGSDPEDPQTFLNVPTTEEPAKTQDRTGKSNKDFEQKEDNLEPEEKISNTENPEENTSKFEETTVPVEMTSTSADTTTEIISTTEFQTTSVPLQTTEVPMVTSTKAVPPKRTGSRSLSPKRRGTKTFSQNFFPITFGGSGRSVGVPEGNVAIANSFSTGRGGIASSSASSFGGFDARRFNRGQN